MSRAEQYAELDPDITARWMKFARAGDELFPQLLGFVVEDVRVDYCRMRLPYRPNLRQGGGILHGGAIASLLDAVLVPAIGAALDRGARFSTVDLHIQFQGAVKDEDVVAEGWVTKRGRTVVFGESEVVGDRSGKVLAKAALTYNVAA